MLRLQDTKTGKFTLWRCIVRSSPCSDACYAGLAEAALGEGSGVKLHKLSVKELKAVRSTLVPISLCKVCSPTIHQLFGMGAPNGQERVQLDLRQ